MLEKEKKAVFLDATVLINFLGGQVLTEILQILPFQFFITEPVFEEVNFDPVKKKKEPGLLLPILNAKKLSLIEMDSEEIELYFDLLYAPNQDAIGKGEAATLSCASYRKVIFATDDKKARRICSERFPEIEMLCSVELFQMFRKESKRKPDEFQQILFQAIQKARMRVLPEHDQWVKEILGEKLLRECKSLNLKRIL